MTVSEHSLVLKEVKVPLWPHSKCQSSLRRNFGANYLLPKTNICAGEEGNDACDVSIFFLPLPFTVAFPHSLTLALPPPPLPPSLGQLCYYLLTTKNNTLQCRATEVDRWSARKMAPGIKLVLFHLVSAVAVEIHQVLLPM